VWKNDMRCNIPLFMLVIDEIQLSQKNCLGFSGINRLKTELLEK
jgi:hypothetical protein